MTPQRSHASADSYDPFEDTRGPVSQALHFDVERIPGAAPGEPARFRKTIKPGAGDELLRMIHRENMLLMDMAAQRLTHVAQSLEFTRLSSEMPFVVTTLDAGPSLNLWQRHDFARPDDGRATARTLLTPSVFVHLLQQLLMVLREFHAAGFVHCDIHAGNVCLPFERHPATPRAVRPLYRQLRLIDFGHTLSARLRLEAPLCLDPDAAESLRRVSPAFRTALRSDTARGRAHEVNKLDFRLDLHALGALAAQWLGHVDWASQPQAVALQPSIAASVATLLGQDCDGMPAAEGLHERLLSPLDELAARLEPPPADWLLPQRRPARAAAASPIAARETPLIVARPTPVALPVGSRVAAASGSLAGLPPAFASPAPELAAASPQGPASAPATAAVDAGLGHPPPASVAASRSHLLLWTLAGAAVLAGAWAFSQLGGSEPPPASTAARRSATAAKAPAPPAPEASTTERTQQSAPPTRATAALTPRELEEQLDRMMNGAASGAWADVESVARRIAVAAEAPPSGPSAQVQAGLQAIESADYESAAETLRRATEQAPDDWRAWSALGYAALRLEHVQEAKAALIRSLRLYPQDASAWAHLGEIFALQDQKRAAAKGLRLAVYFSTQRARTLAHLRESESSAIDPQFRAVINEEGGKLDRIPERVP
ncbi:MAG TPA: tetratricopeptide repeat protein [Rubrivivax sp.]|nr:tetratricopeptide repeat protein [Rubrivivax sp.]